jgi:hypothetical protein
MTDARSSNVRHKLTLAYGPRLVKGIPEVGLARRRNDLMMTRWLCLIIRCLLFSMGGCNNSYMIYKGPQQRLDVACLGSNGLQHRPAARFPRPSDP